MLALLGKRITDEDGKKGEGSESDSDGD